MFETRPRNEMTENVNFFQNNNLNLHSHHVKWFEALMPVNYCQHDMLDVFCMNDLLSWTNLKSRMEHADNIGGKYPVLNTSISNTCSITWKCICSRAYNLLCK